MPYTISTNIVTVETWNFVHNDEQHAVLEAKREEMFTAGKLARKFGAPTVVKLSDDTETTTDVKYFWNSVEAANEYVEFLNSVTPAPTSVAVQS